MKFGAISFFGLLVIILIFFNLINKSSTKFSENEILKCESLNSKYSNFLDKTSIKNLKLEIKFYDERKWKRRIIKGHKISFENEEKYGHRLFSYNKRSKGFVFIELPDNRKCLIEAEIRPHGDFLDHRSGLDLPSLNIILVNGNIKGIKRFILFRPLSRHYDNEILASSFFSEVGFLSPRTSNVRVLYNERYYDFIFQENISKELLEFNSFREGVIIKCDERFAWFDDFSIEKLSYYRAWNTSFSEKSEKNMSMAEFSVSLLNNLLRIHKNEISSKMVVDYHTVSKNLNKDFFRDLDVYDALSYALEAPHGLSRDDRRFYFNIEEKIFYPIYYDGMSRMVTLDNKPVHLNPNTPHFRKTYFRQGSNTKFIPSVKSGAEKALILADNIDIENFHTTLLERGMDINKKDLINVLERIKNNLKNLSKISHNRIYKVNINIDETPYMTEADNYNKELKRRLMFYEKFPNKFLNCNLQGSDCKQINLDMSQKVKLLNQRLLLDKMEIIYVGKKKNNSPNNGWYYQSR